MLRHLLLIALALAAALCPAKNKEQDRFLRPEPIHLDRSGKKWADKTLRHMSTEDKVGQLFGIKVLAQFLNDADPRWIKLRDEVRKYHVGALVMTVPVDGPVLLRSQPYVAAELLNRLQRSSKLPLLVSADFERGVSMRVNGTTVFPHAMAFGASGKTENAEVFGRISALEARAIGVHWNFFPIADVNSNPLNPIINTRSFGGDPTQVGDFVAAYIRGAHEGGMLVTAKHFPGHGDTATDSHLGFAQVTGDRAQLDEVELPPFRRAIESGVDAVMVAHVTVPALDSEPNRVATTSKAIVTGLLREDLGFKGIVVTDALDMAGLTRLYAQDTGRAAVDSFKAGNDVLIIPHDLDASYRAMVQAVKSGEISRPRLDASVRKILETKAAIGLNKARLVDLSQLSSEIAKPENLTAGQRIADEAITLVRDNGKVIPLQASSTIPGTSQPALPYQPLTEAGNRLVAVIFSDDLRTDSGRMLEHQILARVPDARVLYVDARSAAGMKASILEAIAAAERVIAAVYVVPTAGKALRTAGGGVKNSVAMDDATAALLREILDRAAERTVVLAMGNPYLVRDFPAIENYVCAFSNVTVSETAAVKAVFGEIAIGGHLPVTIPDVAARGDGMERPAQNAAQPSSGGSSDVRQDNVRQNDAKQNIP
ncbi:MAG TPA: glycoside hydrolase family 3 N-terminal domain-containing protein [Terriglobales bacterium]|jgi:beta-N-acetylhexosaminidase|nr:glycoside hydrolase family 3 N-terminal domain-containing protein [Terriglobales bacterium]